MDKKERVNFLKKQIIRLRTEGKNVFLLKAIQIAKEIKNID